MQFGPTSASPTPAIEYMGCATSHFQSEPIIYDPRGEKVPPVSDWEYELAKNLRGEKSGIKTRQNEAALPRFLEKADEYIARSSELGHNMFRFSLDFARLCPRELQFDSKLMAEYVRILALLKSRGQEPMLTLSHFTMPTYLLRIDEDGRIARGGWEHPDVLHQLRFYIESVVNFLEDEDKVREALSQRYGKELQDQVLSEGLARYFLSINEPIITPLNGYFLGTFPPYKRFRVVTGNKILNRMVQAHDIIREQLKRLGRKMPKNREPQIGVGYNWQYYDGKFSGISNELLNRFYADKFERNGSYSDFVGLHYYYRQTLLRYSKRRKGRDYSDMPTFGDIYPAGIFKVLTKMHRSYPGKNIFVSEIGFSDAHDTRRPFWLLETVRHILRAQDQGIPIKGILLWSLANNFEWEMGMTQNFGVFAESELSDPLVSNEQGIRSWEAWKSAVNAIRKPSKESLSDVQQSYERARAQYDESV